ncbi:MAG: hypothetical protein AAB266_06435 [Nitrospirota bacterium]
MPLYAAVKGYKAALTIPVKISSEKNNLLEAFGAEVDSVISTSIF